jgi:hypothetical protein
MTHQDHPLDPFSADASLDGSARESGDPLSDILTTLSGVGLPSELEGESADLQSMTAAITASPAAKTPRSRRRLTTRTSALAAAGSLLFSGVAAAAAGVPVPIVSEVVDEIFAPIETPTLVDLGDDDVDVESGDGQDPKLAVNERDSDDNAEVEEGSPDGSVKQDEPAGDDAQSGPQKDSQDQTDTDEEADGGTEGDAGADATGEEPGNSVRAHSDCGKPDAEPTGDPECDDAENHGGHVSDGDGDGNGGGNGNSNGNGNGNGEPADDAGGSEHGNASGTANGNGNANSNGNAKSNGNANSNGNWNGEPADDAGGSEHGNAGGTANGNGNTNSNSNSNGNTNSNGNNGKG